MVFFPVFYPANKHNPLHLGGIRQDKQMKSEIET